jgi:HEAT repeat protein
MNTSRPHAAVCRRRFRTCGAAMALLVLAAPVARAQQSDQPPQQLPASEVLLIAQGWGYLSTGDASHAASVAMQILEQNPRSINGVSLAVEAAMRTGGAAAGLTAYERWLATRKVDAPYVLRRIARTYLWEAMGDVGARGDAITALVDDGDARALAQATAAAERGSLIDRKALAETGDERTVRALIAELQASPEQRNYVIDALAGSHSPLAVPPLMALLADPNPDTRARVADALGRLPAAQAISKLRPLLDESQPMSVRFSAARALIRLGDAAGDVFMRNLLASHPEPSPGYGMLRAQAAEALAIAGPDQEALATARQLLNDPDPQVRAAAARIIAPYDNHTAKITLEGLVADSNPAIRQLGARLLAGEVAGDFVTLRGLLRSADAATRTSAAARILELTR